jgi:hypothetical protein
MAPNLLLGQLHRLVGNLFLNSHLWIQRLERGGIQCYKVLQTAHSLKLIFRIMCKKMYFVYNIIGEYKFQKLYHEKK